MPKPTKSIWQGMANPVTPPMTVQAEYELMHLPLRKIAQLDGAAIEKQTTRHLHLIDLAHECRC